MGKNAQRKRALKEERKGRQALAEDTNLNVETKNDSGGVVHNYCELFDDLSTVEEVGDRIIKFADGYRPLGFDDEFESAYVSFNEAVGQLPMLKNMTPMMQSRAAWLLRIAIDRALLAGHANFRLNSRLVRHVMKRANADKFRAFWKSFQPSLNEAINS